MQLAAAKRDRGEVERSLKEACGGTVRLNNHLVTVLAKASSDTGMPPKHRRELFERVKKQVRASTALVHTALRLGEWSQRRRRVLWS